MKIKDLTQFNSELRKEILKQHQKAIDYLEPAESISEKHEAVHEARKAFKKIRAAFRLVRDENPDLYKRWNVFYRDLGRELSEIRDATAYLESLDALNEQFDDSIYQGTFNTLEYALKNYRSELADDVFSNKQADQKVVEALKTREAEIKCLDFGIEDFEQIEDSIARVYKRGREGLKASRESATAKDRHEWRKRVKYLRYQMKYLQMLWEKPIKAYRKELHDLTDLLGTDHDLHNLREMSFELEKTFEDDEERLLFNNMVKGEQRLMREYALLLGNKAYHHKPKKFVKQFETFWNSYMVSKNIERKMPNLSSLATT